ncbi:MAG: hypothetical protein R2867_29040 [Caldilineaceae bacterium]
MQTVTHIFLDGWLGGGRMMGMGRGFFFFPGGLFTLLSLLLLIALPDLGHPSLVRQSSNAGSRGH